MKIRIIALAQTFLVLTFMSVLPGTVVAQEYSSKGADSCLGCHRSAKWPVMAIFNTKHGSQTDPDAPFSNLQCEACHGPSQDHRKAKDKAEVQPTRTFGKGDSAPVSDQNGACLSCHEAHTGAGWFGSRHESVDVACVSCHTIHADRDPMFDPIEQQETCFTCHPRTRSDTYKASGHPLRFGSMACSDCHNVHDGNSDFLLVEDNVNDTCYTCHADKRGPFLWEHAPVTESCTLCHDPHGSNHPAMLTKRPPLLCQQCHSAAFHPSTAYGAEGLPGAAANPNLLGKNCLNCHSQTHGSNHPSGARLTR